MNPVKKIVRLIDDRSGFSEVIVPLLKHPVPPGSKWAYVFGSATLFCFVLQVVTGVALSLLYQPSSESAYQSLQFISTRATMGYWLRGIHFYGASGMILLAGIHMLRVYLTASYKFPREMSWISGVFLLVFTLMMGFTGQLLRWDSNGVWSSVIAAEQLGRVPLIGKSLARLLIGGDTIGGQSLSRFYSYHVFIFPALLFLFIGYHLMLVVRNGISEPPDIQRPVDPRTYRSWYKGMLQQKGVPFWPDAAWRDALFGVGVILCILVLAVLVGPPALTSPPNPALVHATPRPDWFMAPIFSLFALMPPKIESYVIFFGPILTMALLLAFPFISNRGQRSPLKRPWAILGVIGVVLVVGSLLWVGVLSPWSPKFNARPLPAAALPAGASPSVGSGAALFNTKGCLYCHRIAGYGGRVGPDLSHIGRRLQPAEITLRIVNGGPDMPAYGGMLTQKELRNLSDFLAGER